MGEPQAGSECPLANQPPPILQPCLYMLGAHVLEVLEDETAIIVKIEEMSEIVLLSKEELYYLLQVLQDLFRLVCMGG